MALRLPDIDDQHPSLGVHQMRGMPDRDLAWRATSPAAGRRVIAQREPSHSARSTPASRNILVRRPGPISPWCGFGSGTLVAPHVLVVPAGERAGEAEAAQAGDQLAPSDRPE